MICPKLIDDFREYHRLFGAQINGRFGFGAIISAGAPRMDSFALTAEPGMKCRNGSGERRILRDKIRDQLIRDILDGRRAPGDRIIETRVARQFKVSQAPVREALRDLELFGFIDSAPFRSSVVREPSVQDLVQVYPIRAALEGVGARDAAPHITKAQLAKLQRLIREMREAARRNDERACVDADMLFHLTIIEASGNSLLKQSWERLRLANTTAITVSTTKHSLFDIAESHVPVFKALKARKPGLAERLMRQHIENAGHWLRAHFESEHARGRRLPDRRFTARVS